jgi:hypothetical protein
MANSKLIFTGMIAVLGLSMQALPSFASYTQEFSGRSPEDIQKKAIQNGFSYPSNAVQCNGMICYQKWVKE